MPLPPPSPGPDQVAGAPAGYDPDLSTHPITQAEAMLAIHDRPAPTPIPRPGEVVWFRAQPFGDLVEAVVEAVQDPHVHPAGEPDPNLWYRDTETGAPVCLLDDPWPTLTLDTLWTDESGTASRVRLTTREARVRGAVGWLPHDWAAPPTRPEHLAGLQTRYEAWKHGDHRPRALRSQDNEPGVR